MALHKVDDNGDKKLQLINPTSFVNGTWSEKKLQALLRDSPESIDLEIYILGEEVSSWEGSARRIDLLAISLQRGG